MAYLNNDAQDPKDFDAMVEKEKIMEQLLQLLLLEMAYLKYETCFIERGKKITVTYIVDKKNTAFITPTSKELALVTIFKDTTLILSNQHEIKGLAKKLNDYFGLTN